jgi:hypothetical protein
MLVSIFCRKTAWKANKNGEAKIRGPAIRYYTACPNPFIEDFIKQYGKPYDPATDDYRREPFATDISEGKKDPIYNAHSYHTKVPPKAIERYLVHYSGPGDIILDCFCERGMTGVATERVGKRRAILVDLFPTATFIANNYVKSLDSKVLQIEADRLLSQVDNELGWLFKTAHAGQQKGTINYVIWSDVLLCSECSKEIIFWHAAVHWKSGEKGKVESNFNCSHCNAELTKRSLNRAFENFFDPSLNKVVRRRKLTAGTEDGVWDFVRTHLKQLPVFVSKDGQAEVIAERQNYLLFDRMVAFHVQRGVTVPLSAAEFYKGLGRFSERDGMFFLPDQVVEYDKKRMTVREILQLQLFVSDEESAIQWLKQQLTRKPQTFQDINPLFMKEVGGWQKHEKPPELSELLEQNFLRYDGKGEVSSQIHSYLSSNFKELRNLAKDDPALKAKGKDRLYVPDPNKAGDLEKLRERALTREFEEYRESEQKRLKVFRLEAVRAGFKKAWQDRDYNTIIQVAEKIPDTVLQEDPKLLMWYDQAATRTGG